MISDTSNKFPHNYLWNCSQIDLKIVLKFVPEIVPEIVSRIVPKITSKIFPKIDLKNINTKFMGLVELKIKLTKIVFSKIFSFCCLFIGRSE